MRLGKRYVSYYLMCAYLRPEKLGIHVVDAERFPMACSNPKLRKHAFRATRWTGSPHNMAHDEHDDLGWFTDEELPSLAMSDLAALTDLVNAIGHA